MKAFAALAVHAFREALHSRVGFILPVYLGLMTVGYIFLGAADAADRVRVLESMAFIAMSFFGSLLALLMPVLSLSEEIETRKVYNLLTKPVNRFVFLAGKIAGIMLFVFVFVAVIALVAFGFIRLAARQAPATLAADRLLAADRVEWVRADGTRTALAEGMAFTRTSEFTAAQWHFSGITLADREGDAVRARLDLAAYGVGVVFNIDFSRVYINAINPETGARLPVTAAAAPAGQAYVVIPKDETVMIRIPGAAVTPTGAVIVEVLRPGSKYRLLPRSDSVAVYRRPGVYAVNYIKGVLFLFVRFGFIAAVAVCGGAFFSLASGISFGLFVILMGHLMGFIRENAAPSEEGAFRILYLLFRIVAPDFQSFSRAGDVIAGTWIPWGALGITAALALGVYGLAYLGIAYAGLRDREF
ncbi:MAG: hypothetical protein ABIF71_13875 [Planctomycetota bacterium]